MKDEIKEILEDYNCIPRIKKLGDCITNLQQINNNQAKRNSRQRLANQKQQDLILNLQQENKEWGMIFDTFSKRPYAHRYLEEKRKELGNKRIIGRDSEMIYREYYNLKEIEQNHKETNATLMSELAKLGLENERLKENAIHNDKVVDKAKWNEMIYKSRCEKAIEYIHNHQLVFELSSKEQIQEWFEKEYYVDLLNILQNGSEKIG